MSWDRYGLGKHNIFYDEELLPSHAEVLPVHVDRVRRSLLDFSCMLNGKHGLGHSTLDDRNVERAAIERNADPALKAALRIHAEASALNEGGHSEDTWESMFERHFFEALSDSVSLCMKDSRRCPKPDQTFYLPIYHTDNGVGLPKVVDPEARQWSHAQDTSGTDPYSWSSLKALHESGLRPTTSKIFQRLPQDAKLKCYPWFVVEHKKEKEGSDRLESVVSCQAANAAACAIKLVQNSAQYALELPDEAHIPPIPTMTTVGSQVTIWLAYYAKDFSAPCTRRSTNEVKAKRRFKGYVMRSIWKGEMTELTDVVKLQMILDNTHTWAMRFFKPLVASYIEQWRAVHCHPISDAVTTRVLLDEAKLRRDKTIAQRKIVLPIVQGLLEDQAAMELDAMAGNKVTPLLLGLLMHQICSSERQSISSEIDRVVTDRFRNLSIPPTAPGIGRIRTSERMFGGFIRPAGQSERETPSSTPSTQVPLEPDDSQDESYIPSQRGPILTGSTNGAEDEASDAEGSIAMSSASEFADEPITLASFHNTSQTPRARRVTRQNPERPRLPNRDSTPGSGSTVSGSPETTPKPTNSRGRASSGWVPVSPSPALRDRNRQGLTGGNPTGSPVFAGRSTPRGSVWPPGQQFGSFSWSSPVFQQDQDRQESDEESRAGQSNKGNPNYIDLTNDN
ncbi:hypothetical protein ACHAO9_010811 [Fusarium lateritium]